jgi:hypothetical protein
MDFAQANQVLVSRSYYDVISRITDDTADLFRYLGQFEDKHGRQHEVYSVAHALRGAAQTGTTRREGPSTGYTQTQPMKTLKPLEPDDVREVEMDLARNIGPLARVLVRKAQPLAATIQALREALAPSIQEPRARETFLAGTTTHTQSGHPNSRPRDASQPVSTPSRSPASGRTTTSQFGALGPSSQSAPLSPRSGPPSQGRSQPLSQPPSQLSRPAGNGRVLEVLPEELAIIEQTLSKFIGPMAKVLIRKETSRRGTFKEFVEAIAGNVDKPAQRAEFLHALKRALPRRQQ